MRAYVAGQIGRVPDLFDALGQDFGGFIPEAFKFLGCEADVGVIVEQDVELVFADFLAGAETGGGEVG